jgi:uncharacterized protein with NAD-binding domain and iron-sulfur cluster
MRIAILGGGVGSMTAAYWLTNRLPDGSLPPHDITVYQLGWRLGGKGASGRNAAAGQRIEEHGLHIWMGFYANAFRMMRAVYEELNRPPGAPLATWKDAFKPQTVVSMMDTDADGQWIQNEWVVATPIMPGEPGDQTGFGDPCDYHFNILEWVKARVEAFLEGREHSGAHHPHHPTHIAHLQALHAALHAATSHAGDPHERGRRSAKPRQHHHLLLQLALEAIHELIGAGFLISGTCVEFRRLLMLADVSVATLRGMIKDLCGKPWDAIDDEEWRAWLTRHGMHKETAWSSIIRAMYDIVFAYRGGDATDPSTADLAAGTTTCAMVRIYFDYYESIFLKMQGGMGDTIFGPIYEVLKKRGVKFRYFHRLEEVLPSDDGTRIDALRIGVQVKTKGDYQPLVDVKGLPSWPSEPLWDQLEDGERLRAAKSDFEAYATPCIDEFTLRRGTDFDHVVFGLSVGAVARVCPRLLGQKEPWRQMVEKVKVVRTQAAQLWFSRNVADLGWTSALNGRCYGERAVFGTYVEPMDTWADMSQLLPLEDWSVPVNNVAYFCGPMRDDDPITTDVPRELMRDLLENHMYLPWVYAAKQGSFRYDWLVVEGGAATDEDRFRRQYFRVNTEPTELYVLSVSGSTKYRLDPADNGYANLSLAGDWVSNGFAIGCVESAVLGAMKGVQRFCPGMQIVE